MVRLPNPGSDDNTWGDLLNEYLLVEHDKNGQLRKSTLITGAEQSVNKGIANGYAPLDATGKVPRANLPTSSSSPIIASKAYMPDSDFSLLVTSTAYADVDAANAAISFTATSTAVFISVQACFLGSFGQSGNVPITYVAGLTIGSTHTYKLALHGNGTQGLRVTYGPNYGPLLMYITAR